MPCVRLLRKFSVSWDSADASGLKGLAPRGLALGCSLAFVFAYLLPCVSAVLKPCRSSAMRVIEPDTALNSVATFSAKAEAEAQLSESWTWVC